MKFSIKKQINKKSVLYATIIFSIILVVGFPIYFRADFGDILATGVAKLIVVIGDALYALLKVGDTPTTSLNMSISKLVFNADTMNASNNIKDLNLTLLRTDAINKGIMTIYNLMWTISISILSFSGLWFTIDFIKTADNPQHKKELKDKLTKLAIAILLLANINLMIETFLVLNQVFLDSFRLLIKSIVNPDMDLEGPFLMSTFKTLADPDGKGSSIPMAIAYVGCGGLNIWLVVYYIIRDLTICFLYLFAPVMIVLIPHKLDMFVKWLKEMASNIFSQSVQGMILTIILASATTLTSKSSFYDNLFCLVAFAMFVPLTGMVKKLIGLEGDFGAAKSTAGIAGVMGALALGGAVVGMAKKAGSGVVSAGADYGNARAELKNHTNGVGSSVKTGNATTGGSTVGGNGIEASKTGNTARMQDGVDRNLNTTMTKDLKDDKNEKNNATTIGNQLKGQKKIARRKLVSSIVGAAGGAIGGVNMGVGMAMLNPLAGGIGAKMGSEMGDSAGQAVGKTGNVVANVAGDKAQDLAFGKGIRYDGVQRGELTPLNEGVDMDWSNPMKSMKSGASKIGNNLKQNFEQAKTYSGIGNAFSGKEARGDASEARDGQYQEMYGIDKGSLSEGNYKNEVKANLASQKHQQRGNFDKAHRKYASKTYNRHQNNDAMFENHVQAGSQRKEDLKSRFGVKHQEFKEMQARKEYGKERDRVRDLSEAYLEDERVEHDGANNSYLDQGIFNEIEMLSALDSDISEQLMPKSEAGLYASSMNNQLV